MSEQARVGLLVLAGAALFFLVLFAVANRSFLLSDTFFVNARYSEVAGLQSGASVQFQGVSVGRVEQVSLPESAEGKIVVTMAIRENAKHLVHTNTRALIKSDGLVGNTIVVLANPTQAELGPQADEGDFINGVNPFNLYEITDRLLATANRFEDAAVAAEQIMQDVRNEEGTLGKLIYDPQVYNSFVATTQEAERTLAGIGESAEEIVTTAQDATDGVNAILQKVNTGEGSLALLLNDPGFYNQLLAASDTISAVANNLESITSSAQNAANWASLGAYRFAELMEAGKHNFLFKSYFEERGYYEKAPFEVRESAIESSYQDLEAMQQELMRWEQRLEAREARLNDGQERQEPDTTQFSQQAEPQR